MGPGTERDIRPYHDMVSHVDTGIVYHCQIEIHIDVVPKVCKFSCPVGMKRRFDRTVFPDFSEHFLQERLPPFCLRRARQIIVIKLFQCFSLFLGQFVCKQVKLAGMHSLSCVTAVHGSLLYVVCESKSKQISDGTHYRVFRHGFATNNPDSESESCKCDKLFLLHWL